MKFILVKFSVGHSTVLKSDESTDYLSSLEAFKQLYDKQCSKFWLDDLICRKTFQSINFKNIYNQGFMF